MNEQVFHSQQAKEIIAYARNQYGDELEFLWQKFPKDAILRNKKNQKWYALFLTIPRNKLAGQTSDEEVEVIDVRFPKNEAHDFAESNDNVFPGYHMNKNNWITIILDGSMELKQILDLLDNSYNISLKSK